MDILTAVIIVGVIGLVLGLGLAVASIVFAVPKDEKAEAVRECLPGANCGACGFSDVTVMLLLWQKVKLTILLFVHRVVMQYQKILQLS